MKWCRNCRRNLMSQCQFDCGARRGDIKGVCVRVCVGGGGAAWREIFCNTGFVYRIIFLASTAGAQRGEKAPPTRARGEPTPRALKRATRRLVYFCIIMSTNSS